MNIAMKKKIFMGALVAIMFTACSNDELTDVNRDGDEITFGVVTNASTRAENVYCSNNKPTDFKVWATFNNKTYFEGDEIKYEDGKWVNTTGTRYWPDGGAVTFYAHKNAGEAFNWDNGSPKIENFTVGTDVAGQTDLIYAVKSQTKTVAGADGKVTLNFRHALSQIVFQAKNTNPTLYVEISGVSVCNVGSKNTFTYPSEDTDNNYENHEGTEDNNTSFGNHWGTISDPTSYSVTFAAVDVPGNKTNPEIKSLTNTNDKPDDATTKEFSSTAMLLLPQTTQQWDITSSATGNGNPSNQTGTYFLVKCRIWNVAATTGLVDKVNDIYLWGNAAEAKNIAIPVELNWEEGKKYVYTFVFGDGNGGYDPDPEDPNPDDPDNPDPDPTPVLVPITFEVTVDDFVPVSEDIEMDKPTA